MPHQSWKRNPRFDHLFVVIRVDLNSAFSTHADIEQAITVTRAFCLKEEAEPEAARLNELNRSKGCTYFWRVARIRPHREPPNPGSSEQGTEPEDNRERT